MDNWYDDFQSEHLTTPEAQRILSQYKSQEDFNIGAIEAKKMVGAPYKLPKSLESLPDDNTRSEFSLQVGKLLGAEDLISGRIKSEDDLKDLNFNEGLADVRNANPEFEKALKAYAVEKKWPKSIVKDLIGFINPFNQNLINAKSKSELDEFNKVNEILEVLYGGKDAVKSNYENTRRLFQNHTGITADEYEKAGKSFIEKVLMKDAVMSKAIFNLAKDIVPEGNTEVTGAPAGKVKESDSLKEEMPYTANVLKW
uniref:Uncharacterized protein n=1 Tax=viral metagenome TaxID=1070528 RepID=A0A6M3JAM3_9ZZZZ